MTIQTTKTPDRCKDCGPKHVAHADRRCRAMIEGVVAGRLDGGHVLLRSGFRCSGGHGEYAWCSCGPDTSRAPGRP